MFNVYNTLRRLKKGKYAKHVKPGAAIYSTAVLEYFMAEVAELAGNCATTNKKKHIIPRHISLAVKMDDELNQVFTSGGVIMPQGGVVPGIHKCLLNKVDPDTFRGWSRKPLSGGTRKMD